MEPGRQFGKVFNFIAARALKRDRQISQTTPFGPMDARTQNRIKHQEVVNLEQEAKDKK